MYNSYQARKQEQVKKSIQIKQQKLKNWVYKYYKRDRPNLLDRYNRRINSFIRKMEQNPVHIKTQQLSSTNMHKLFRNIYQKQSFVGDQSFKFKDNQDWKSLFTPTQRLQRQNNMKIFKQKYGNADIAFRSIGSQSQYTSVAKKQFRIRNKNLQINPPMKYTNKSSLIKKVSKIQKQKNQQKQSKKSDIQQPIINRRNTSSSMGNFIQQDLRSDIMSVKNSINGQQNIQLLKQKQMENNDKKMHFKRIIDIQQSVTDQKTKKSLKQLLIKCGVYRNKDKRAMSQIQSDKFDQLQ